MIKLKSATFIVILPRKVFQDFASWFNPQFIINIVKVEMLINTHPFSQ